MTKLYDINGNPIFITHPVDVRLALQSGKAYAEDPTKPQLLKKGVKKIEKVNNSSRNREVAKRRGSEKNPSKGTNAVKASFGALSKGKT